MRKSNEKASLDKNTEHNHRATLFGLPTEILLKIFRYVPGADAARVSQTCKTANAIAQISPVKEKILMERNQAIHITTGYDSTFIWRNFPSSCFVAALGNNKYGELGTGDIQRRNDFAQVQLPPSFARIIQIASSKSHTAVLGLDAERKPLLAICGLYWHKSISEFRNRQVPHAITHLTLTQIPKYFNRVDQIAVGLDCTVISGTDVAGHPLIAIRGGKNYGTNDPNKYGRRNFSGDHFSNPPPTHGFIRVDLPEEFAKVLDLAAGEDHILICGLDKYGKSLYAACGSNDSGEFGDWSLSNGNRLMLAKLPKAFFTVSQVVAGGNSSFVCGTNVEGSPILASCGENKNGELGADDYHERRSPGRPGGMAKDLECQSVRNLRLRRLPAGFVSVKKVIFGDGYSIISGENANGKPLLAACGLNKCGQLGTGDNTSVSLFTLVELPESFARVIQIAANSNRTLVYGVNAEGKPLLAVCGLSERGQFSRGYYREENRLTLIPLPECLQPSFCPPRLESEAVQQHDEKEEEPSATGSHCTIS